MMVNKVVIMPAHPGSFCVFEIPSVILKINSRVAVLSQDYLRQRLLSKCYIIISVIRIR